MSMAGEAFMTLPPIVPCARVACEPTMADASARPVKCSRTTGWATSSRCVTSAPRRSPPPVPSMPRRASMPWMPTIRSGSGALPWRAPTTRSVPPATGRAPPPSSWSGLLDGRRGDELAAHRPFSRLALQTRSGVIGSCLTCAADDLRDRVADGARGRDTPAARRRPSSPWARRSRSASRPSGS